MRRREGRGEGGGGVCTAINPDAVPSVHVTKMATCTGEHSIFRISQKIEECEQSTSMCFDLSKVGEFSGIKF